MDIRILEEAASGKISERTPEEAEKFMARIRTNLFDLLCHSDKARAEMPVGLDLDEYGGKEAVGRAIGKAIVNLLALAAVFGVSSGGVILRDLGFALGEDTSVDAAEKDAGGNGSAPRASGNEQTEDEDAKAGAEGEHGEPALTAEVDGGKGCETPEYGRMLDKAGSAEERNAIWKKIQVDRCLDSKTRAELYRHMTSLNKQQAA